MYSSETLKKYTDYMNESLAKYDARNVQGMRVCISKGNKKIGHVMNVSLLAGKTCGNCSGCIKYCYDIKACMRFRKNVLDRRAENTVLATKYRAEYFAQIRDALMHRQVNKFFRWHVSGDILDADYLDNMVKIARDFPNFKFWTYTKRYDIVNAYCDNGGQVPENLSIMFSKWKGMPMDNRHGFPTFETILKGDDRPKGFYCPNGCGYCLRNHRGCPYGESTFVDEH